jgi:proteic killer suppression protein
MSGFAVCKTHAGPPLKQAWIRVARASLQRKFAASGFLLGCSLEPLDTSNVTRYTPFMIKSFADKHTQELYETGRSRRLPPEVLRRAVRRLEYIDLATCLRDLRVPPSNRLHALERERAGQHSISINDQWRICFRLTEGDAFDVEIVDYH